MPNTPLQKTDFSSFLQDTQQLLDRCVELLRNKANDYAEGGDAFLNFKTAAQIAGISPEQTLLTLLGMKLSRLTQLIGKGKKARNESVEDTMLDVINYIVLLRGMMREQEGAVSTEQTLGVFSQSAPNLLQQ
ncbi:hypothetical protein KBD34_01755 [Patescibacteria group bacterium]|nr:hypothetical protein [Patescibacteria group bacterium]